MSDEDLDLNQPDWAFAWEQRPDGRTVFRDEGGEPLVALAVTRDDLRRLKSGFQMLPKGPATVALLDRLATLQADLDESV